MRTGMDVEKLKKKISEKKFGGSLSTLEIADFDASSDSQT